MMTIKQQGGIFGRNPSFNNATAVDVTSDTMSTKSLLIGDNAEAATSPLRVLKKSNGTAAVEWAGGPTSVVYADFYMSASENLSLRLDPTNALSDSYFEVTHNGSALARFTGSTGDLTVNNGNLVIGTSGKGIDFSATSGTGTSELFDDYEEGTWTPSVSGFGGTATVSGSYTRIGNRVFLEFSIGLDGTSDGSAYNILGLPFAPASTGGGYISSTDSGYTNSSNALLLKDSSNASINFNTFGNASTTTFVAFYKT
jgi:hypothetical protein